MFVFGEVQDPNPTAVNLVEDIVRSQVLEIVRSYISQSLLPPPDNSTGHSLEIGNPSKATLC